MAPFGRGVYKSSDGGRTWELRNNAITQKEPFACRLAHAAAATLYVLIARRSENGGIGDAGDGALYKSVYGAATWLPVGANGPNGLAIDSYECAAHVSGRIGAHGLHARRRRGHLPCRLMADTTGAAFWIATSIFTM